MSKNVYETPRPVVRQTGGHIVRVFMVASRWVLEAAMFWHRQQGNCNAEASQCQDAGIEPGGEQKIGNEKG